MCPVLVKLGPITLHTYGLMVAIGFLTAFFVAKKEFEWRNFPPGMLDQIIFGLMMSAIVGARLLYFAVDGFHELVRDPLSLLRIWEGGLVFYGGFIGGFLFLIFYTRRKNLSLLSITDALTAPLLLGQAFGRVGCFFAGCCYGRPTDSWVGVTFTDERALAPLHVALHPTQLYEAAINFLLFAGVFTFRQRLTAKHMTTSYYLIGYGVARFFLEFIRNDDRGFVFLSLAPSQWISIAMVIGGFVLYAQRNAQR